MNRALIIGLSLSYVTGCTQPDVQPDAPVPDFVLLDTNPLSSSFEAEVSPREFLGQISVWYFGHGT